MLTDISNWWANLYGFELILWCIALLFSFLFLAQTVLSFFIGELDDVSFLENIDHDPGNEFFTVKNLIAFFTMFGWAGLAAYKSGISNFLVVLIALAAGTSMVLIMYLLMRNTDKLRNSGTLQMKNAINQVGETYLRIPALRSGLGKVHVQMQGRLVELDAMTDDGEDISTGKPIQVVNILNNQILLVSAHIISK
jgi:hypothetical protein